MKELYSLLLSKSVELMILILILQFVTITCCFILWIRQSRQGKMLKRLDGDAEWLKELTDENGAQGLQLMHLLSRLDSSTRKLQGRLGLVRYNAVGERATDMSFSLALINEEKDGVVISSLFSNHGPSYIYAKPVEGGESAYPLSKEEKQAIEQAVRTEGSWGTKRPDHNVQGSG
ncbi:uncharacterized protein DUF4446 [Melghirimyces profundicolus]|uniref:Uncharacterized protein DUF4446 n=1 Tax=Melghirimyces profundicolus TaxID=1242148 RepID=A0A2T6C281_9BACL|nr:DUF4446 family protein [Melghirimyces profundicolus]PTX62420.1 uncharacterized protein DUF4446 [Melghirimyces profundicolus]